MVKWKEETRFGKVVGSECKVGRFRLSIHRHISYEPDQLFVTCDPFYVTKLLVSKELEEAQDQALNMVQRHLESALKDLLSLQKEAK